MKSTIVLFIFTFCLNNYTFCQNKSTLLEGTTKIEAYLAMKVAEVNIQEWMIFILDNHYDSTLFPSINLLSKPAQLLFLDLKKRKDFKYLKISKKKDHDLGEIETVSQTSAFTRLCKEDSIEFSILATPITAITYSQVKQYCAWLETVVKRHREIDITISLPPGPLYHYVITNLDSLNHQGCALYNFIHCSCVSQTKKDINQSLGKYLVRADAYFPTALGLYNLQGNAAEMTTSEGEAKGGSYRHYAKDSYNNQIQHYIGAEDWLGFRYIVINN